jgi:hypothetical protein
MNKINVELELTDQEITDIVITALEGGIGYWACLVNEGKDFENFYKDQRGISTSEFVAGLLLSNKSVYFYDTESAIDEVEHWKLNLRSLLYGIELYVEKNKDINFMENLDSVVADNIFQYAMFNELIYG